jgi:hypothetical protein
VIAVQKMTNSTPSSIQREVEEPCMQQPAVRGTENATSDVSVFERTGLDGAIELFPTVWRRITEALTVPYSQASATAGDAFPYNMSAALSNCLTFTSEYL